MSNTKIKSSQFHGVVGHGTDGYFLITNGDGSMSWISNIVNPVISSLSYPGSATAADPAGGETITITGTGFKTGATVTVGGTAAPSVSYVSATSLNITTPAKAAGDYDVVVTNTDGGTATSVNGISFNGIPSWTTAAGTLGTFASDTTISTITLQASEPDAGTITFSITNGALPTGLSLTGADIDGTTTLETADTLYTFTVTATDDETQTTPRTFTITVTKQFINTENFTINTYTGNGSTQSIEGKIDTAASFNGSSSVIQASGVNQFFNNWNDTSWSAWINTTDTSAQYIVCTSTDSQNYKLIGSIGSNKFQIVTRRSGTVYSGTSTTDVNDGNWHHIVATYESSTGTVKGYIDGSEEISFSTGGSSSATFSVYDFCIGANKQGSNVYNPLDGKIDQVRIFNKKLSTSEVTTLYGESNTSTTKSTTDIFNDGSGVALYEFEEGAKDTGGVTGYIGSGGIFNGSSSYIRLPNNLINNISPQAFSVSLWINPSVYASSRGVLGAYGYESNVNKGWVIYLNSNVIRFLSYSSNGNMDFSSNATIPLNTWTHVVITYDSSNCTIYLNGSNDNSVSTPGNRTYASSHPYVLGANDDGGTIVGHITAKLDQVRIFDKAISSSEVTTLYGETSASATKSTTDIFSDSSGIALYELEGNANDTGTNDFEHHFFVSDAGSSSSSVRLNSTDADFTYTKPSGYSEWGGAFDVNNQSHQFSGNSSYVTLSESNKKWDKSGSQYNAIWGENSYSSGKYYFELEYLGAELFFGIIKQSTATTLYDGNVVKENSISYGSWNTTSYKYSTTNSSQGTALSTNDVLGFAVDFDNKELKYYINNTLQDTTSLQEIIYNGTASNVTYQEATNFSPDLVWIKDRDSSVYDSIIFDSVRDVNKYIFPSATNAEGTATTLTSFDSNGFSLNTNGSGINANGNSHVAWCFNAGTDAAASNTDGTITSTVKANPDAGFSVVKWTGNGTNGATIGHGLSSSPEIIITKGLSNPTSWVVGIGGVSGFGVNDFMTLQTTAAKGSTTTFYQAYGTDTFQVGVSGANEMNKNSSNDYISYCFHSVDGIQKVGSYTSQYPNTTHIETGFEPAFVMIKSYNQARNWAIHDNKRKVTNSDQRQLYANLSSAEADIDDQIEFTSNGFTVKGGSNDLDGGSSYSYIYLAIAADPDTTTPTVENSFEVVTYTGNGGTQSIDTGFKPDFVWIKDRAGTDNHALTDSVRGTNKILFSNLTNSESTDTDNITSFDTNGFSLGSSSRVNASGENHVAWVWKAGDHDDNLPQINTEGTIDSVVSVNDEAGFSIVKYTGNGTAGATVAHGLSQPPDLIIAKGIESASAYNWMVYASSATTTLGKTGEHGHAYLNLTNPYEEPVDPSVKSIWNDTAPTSSVFSISDNVNINVNNADYIAYCFTSITGYQKIGSYTGTGATGNAVTTGFSPKFVMIKASSATTYGHWIMFDYKRDSGSGFNPLYADLSNQEGGGAGSDVDFNSNGFTLNLSPFSTFNGDGVSYIYLAIA